MKREKYAHYLAEFELPLRVISRWINDLRKLDVERVWRADEKELFDTIIYHTYMASEKLPSLVNDFLSQGGNSHFFSHDLGGHIYAIVANVDFINANIGTRLSSEQLNILQRIQTAALFMVSLVEDAVHKIHVDTTIS